MFSLKVLLITFLMIAPIKTYDIRLFGIKGMVSRENKQFVNGIIQRYASVKHGFVIMILNDIHPDYGDYITAAVSKLDTSGYVINFHKNRDASLTIGEKHVKIAVVDPRGDLNNINHIFGKMKVSRAKIIVICARPPSLLLLDLILAAYRRKKCLDAIVVYQLLGKMYVYTVNPFVSDHYSMTKIKVSDDYSYAMQRKAPLMPEDGSVLRLNATDNFFYNKLKDMQGYKVNALFTYEDRTKANSMESKNGVVYFGKDYEALHTIFKHMNATLNIIHIKDVLFGNEVNPWINSNKHTDRLIVKKRIINDYNISVVLHSQPFRIEDGITENTFPHTQDDDCILVRKGKELPLHHQMLYVFSRKAWIFYFFACFGVMVLAVYIGKYTGEKLYTYEEILTEAVRYICLNNFSRYPKISPLNVFLFGWIYFCFFINLLFQSQYTSILTKKSFSKDIDTIQEFYDSGQIAFAFANQIDEIKKIYNGTHFSDFGKRLKLLPEYTAAWESNRDIVYNMSVAEEGLRPFITNHDRAEFLCRSRKYRKNGRALLHLMRESIIPSYQCFQVQHGSPYLPAINKYLRYLQEAGILYFWERMTIFRAEIEGLLVPNEDYEEDSAFDSFDLSQSYAAFFVLLIGYGLASIVFVLEVVYKYVGNCRNVKTYPFVK